MKFSTSNVSIQAFELVQSLQHFFVEKLSEISGRHFEQINWLRNNGNNGGGTRYENSGDIFFNKASINVSQIQYENLREKKLNAASALSTIIHPKHPLMPSMHMHISLTEYKDGNYYWRLMADLNPSNPFEKDKQLFEQTAKSTLGNYFKTAQRDGDKYFFIPTLKKHRGVSHFYLENFNLNSFDEEIEFAKQFGRSIIETYCDILANKHVDLPSKSEQLNQLEYHTLYFFQVLTLDRGTTSGLLVHDQNDIGILGSLPSHISRSHLENWKLKMDFPQNELLERLINCLPEGDVIELNLSIKSKIASEIRNHYKKYPIALSKQASGSVIPPTVENHKN